MDFEVFFGFLEVVLSFFFLEESRDRVDDFDVDTDFNYEADFDFSL